MTISSTVRTAGPYTGTGSVSTYPFAFKVFQASDLLAQQTDTSGNIAALVLTTNYSVTLNADQNASPGGSIVLNSNLPSGYKLIISSQVAELQGTSITNNGGFYPQVVENALDYLTILTQQLQTEVAQCFQLPLAVQGVTTTLPTPVAGSLLGWNATGNAIVNLNPSGVGAGSIFDVNVAPGAAIQSSKLQYQLPATGSVARTVQDRLLDAVSVFDFMTAAQIADVRAGTLTQDVTAAVQAALTASSGKRLYFPAGQYKITAGLIVPSAAYIIGAGIKATFLQFTLASGSSADLFSVNASHTGTWYGMTMRDFIVIDNTPSTNTTAIYVEAVVNGLFENIQIQSAHYGYSFNGGLNKIINNVIGDLGGTKSTCIGVQCTGASAGLGVYDTIVQSATGVGQQVGIGYLFSGGASPTLHGASTYGCAIGCRLNAVSASMLWPELVNCQFDTGQDTGLLIDAGAGGSIYGLSCVNVWAGTNTNYGIHVTQGAGVIDGLDFNGGRVYACGVAGIFIENASNISLCGMHISGNGSGTNPGIYVAGAVGGLVIADNRIGQSAHFANTQNYGIQLAAAAISGAITGNDLTGNVVDGFVNGSTTPLSVIVSGNKGYSQNSPAAPTLLNSWVANGAPSGNPYYYRDSSNVVHVQGIIKNGTLSSAAFTLPVGFRPAGDQYFSCVANGALGVAYVQASTGNVIPQSGSNVYFSLCGISFKAEQ